MNKTIAHIAVGLPLADHFDYFIPVSLRDKINIGQRVRVLFRTKYLIGYVVGFASKSPFPHLKPVVSLIDDTPIFSDIFLKWMKEFSSYYGCSLGEAMEASLPALIRKGNPVEIPLVLAKENNDPKTLEHVLIHDPQDKNWRQKICDLIKENIEKKKKVIFLVPQIALIDKEKEFFKKSFPNLNILTENQNKPKEELQSWLDILSGKIDMVIGTRSAIFSPFSNLGLIVVLKEEDSAYKQEQSPFYHVREMAFMRSRQEGCQIAFVSQVPTPDLWWQAKKGKIKYVYLDSEITNQMQIVDMHNYKKTKSSLISVPLKNAMENVLSRKGRVILFLNRRGFSTSTCCSACAYIIKCQRCDVNLTYLYSKKKLVCPRCSFVQEFPKECPKCKGALLKSTGLGIEKLASEVARVFPQAKVAFFDKETKTPSFSVDVLIATQAIFKLQGELLYDLIGVLQMDTQLYRFDFRLSHPAFSLLIYLRALVKEKIVVQTFMPDNYCLQAASRLDFALFYKQEMKLRKELGFPPFSHLVAIGLRSRKEDIVFGQANELFNVFQEKVKKGVTVLDPHPDIIPKLRDKYRFTIIVKGKSVMNTLKFIKQTLRGFKKKSGVIITINVNP